MWSWWWPSTREPTAYDDDFEDQPAQGGFHQWMLGLSFPVLIFAYGCHMAVMEEGRFGGRISMTLHGDNAVAVGIAAMSLAVFLHCHFFWGNIYDQAWFAVLGKIVSACGFIAGLAFYCIRCGIFGRN